MLRELPDYVKNIGFATIIFMVVVLCYDIHLQYTGSGGGAVGDFSNWFQAFIAIFTLLAVIFGSIKASEIANTTDEIARKSVIVSERSSINALLLELSSKANSMLSEQMNIVDEENKMAVEKAIDHKRKGIMIELDDDSDIDDQHFKYDKLYGHFRRDGRISRFVSNIKKCKFIIENCQFRDDNYYKNILISLLDTSCMTELKEQNYLNRVVRIFEDTNHPDFINQANALRKDYEHAREFLGISSSK